MSIKFYTKKKIFCFTLFINVFFPDPKIKDLWLMGSIWPVTIILASYLYFVLKIGPEIMKYRNPFNIDRIVMVYNALQVVFSAYLVREVRYIKNIIKKYITKIKF